MDAKRLARFDWVILKPLWVIFIALACFYCLRQDWLVGVSMIGMNILIGMVGAALHRRRSARELAAGYPKARNAFGPDDESVAGPGSYAASYTIAPASPGVAAIIGLASAILLRHHGVRLVWAIVLGALGGWLGVFLIVMAFGITEWLRRRKP